MDLEGIVTPIDYAILEEFLIQSNYPTDKTIFVVNGFKEGFKLNYEGNLKDCKRAAPNLKLELEVSWIFGIK